MTADVRQALADAASSVEGIKCHPYYVQTTSAGQALVRLDRIEYPNPFGGVGHWAIVLLLPVDVAAAEKYLEEKVPQVIEAVEEHLVVKSVTPGQINFGTGALIPCALINGHREY